MNDAIVDLSVGLGHSLGLTVIAEGVETRDQLDALRRHGCDVAQGFFICRPVSADEVASWLATNAQTPIPPLTMSSRHSVNSPSGAARAGSGRRRVAVAVAVEGAGRASRCPAVATRV